MIEEGAGHKEIFFFCLWQGNLGKPPHCNAAA